MRTIRFILLLAVLIAGSRIQAQTVDTLGYLQKHIDSLFLVAKDSLVEKHTVDSLKGKDSISLAQFNQFISDSVSFTQADSLALRYYGFVDNIQAFFSKSFADSFAAFKPQVTSEQIQALLAAGAYESIDSLFKTGNTITLDVVLKHIGADSLLSGTNPRVFDFRDGIVISGKPLVSKNDSITYTATFQIPVADPSKLQWVVRGGTIVAQNTNPQNGAVFVKVTWLFNDTINTQPYVALVDFAGKQYAILQVEQEKDNTCCNVYPNNQKLLYGRQPGLLTGGVSKQGSVKNALVSKPKLLPIQDVIMRWDTVIAVPLSAEGSMYDHLSFSFGNLPYFGEFIETGNGTGKLVFSPTIGDQGAFTISIMVDNGRGGRDTIHYTMVVNDDAYPFLDPISDTAVNAGASTTINLHGNDIDGNNYMQWAIQGPSFCSIQDYGLGNAALTINPGMTDTGYFSVRVFLDDGFGLYMEREFHLVVLKNGIFPIRVAPALPTIAANVIHTGAKNYTEEYQWQVMDVHTDTTWQNIVNATAVDYQPPVLTKPWLLYRRITKAKDAGGNILNTNISSVASVKLMDMEGGKINLQNSIVFHTGGPPVLSGQEAASGGMVAQNSTVNYTWQTSLNDGASWTNIGANRDFPSSFPTDLQSNIRVRRVAVLNDPLIDTTTLPEQYWRTYSNEIVIDRVFATPDFEDRNYIRENIVSRKYINDWQAAEMLPNDRKATSTVYLDGLSRPIQGVVKENHYSENTEQWFDLVAPITYEAGGIVAKNFLPYAASDNIGKYKSNAASDQPTYYTNSLGETHAYNQAEFDGSPLNRITKEYGPGTSWGGSNKGVKGNYEVYSAAENVRRWTIGYNSTDLPQSTGVYQSSWLTKAVSEDENGKKVITYINQSGQTILRKVQLADGGSLSTQHAGWLCTYYVYDGLDQLRFIITPKAVAYLDNNSMTFTAGVADELCYRYEYDDRGRIITKKTPGKGVEQMVYDKKDRLLFTTDGNMQAKTQKEWLVSFYDDLSRKVLTGIYKTQKTRAQLQADADNTSNTTQSVTVDGDQVRLNMLPFTTSELGSSTFTPLTYSFYDYYTFSGVKTFKGDLSFAYTGAYDGLNAWHNYIYSVRTYGLPTGAKERVLSTGGSLPTYLRSTFYYDQSGQMIETLKDNIKTGTDITAVQIHFDGRVMSVYKEHSATGTGYTNFPILTKYKYDRSRRLSGISKKINNNTVNYSTPTYWNDLYEDNDNAYKYIALYQYNGLSQQVKKYLSPLYNFAQGIESIEYDYNIRGQLTGINKGYALNEYNGSQWDHFFGIFLGYDNRDNKFAAPEYNGLLTGVQWKSQGDNTPRKFDYQYDNAGRLLQASFTQRGNSGESWNNTKMDFSTKSITYDENGNLLTLTNMGVIPGATAPVTIDQLTYSYQSLTNRLLRVVDQGSLTTNNGKLGDFKDGSNGTTNDDYVYDDNGNLTIDKNKDIKNGSGAGVTYNYLDKPVLVNIDGKGTIEYVYDAGGVKLQKIVTDNSVSPTVVTTTSYIEDFVYEGNDLKYIHHEEGRIRVITPYSNPQDPANEIGGGITLPNSKQGVYDYFITDHLGNVRSTITEEINKAGSICTMENANAQVEQNEEAVFGQPGANNEVEVTRSPVPGGWASKDPNEKVSKLQASSTTPQVGPNVLLKVMAGDKLNMRTDYYFANATGNNNGNYAMSSLVTGLAQALTAGKATDLAKNGVTDITNGISGTGDLQDLFASDNSNTTIPRAYLNYIFLDENFNFVSGPSGFLRVLAAGDGQAPLMATNIQVPKNGWVYVYLSNESTQPVYFDNFAVTHERGRLVQEEHYYAYGLKIAALSSRAVGTLNNKYQYQGASSEFIDELDVNWNEFFLRSYDAQIGRWTTPDPFDEFASPYVGMGNNPVNLTDPSGGIIECPGTGAAIAVIVAQIGANVATGAASAASAYNATFSTGTTNNVAGLTANSNLKNNTGDDPPGSKKNTVANPQQTNANIAIGLTVGGAGWGSTLGSGIGTGIGTGVSTGVGTGTGATIGSSILTTLSYAGIFVLGFVSEFYLPEIAPRAIDKIPGDITVGLPRPILPSVPYYNPALGKKLIDELADLLKKVSKAKGVVYALIAASDGEYNVYTSGSSAPTSKVPLKKGDIWKYGETTNPKDRYDRAYLKQEGVQLLPLHGGNVIQIKAMEKILIYGYFFQFGKLPAGNKMFR